MSDVKMGVLGCGSIAEIAHFPSIARCKGAKLAAVCDSDPAVAESAAKRWGAERWYTDYRELFAKAKLDAVVIATPNNVHRNQAVAAAAHKVHVIVEKPLAVTNVEAWDIVKACRKAGVKLMVGCDRRFWTHNQWAKQLIEDGVIGRLLMSRASLHEHWYNYQNHVARTTFRLDAKVAGGAAISDTGAHVIDLITWLNGSKVRRAVGVAKRLAMPAEYTLCDDTALVMMKYTAYVFVLAIKIAAPVMITLTLTDVALGTIAKLMPTMNIFIVGFPLKIGVGLMVVALSLPVFAYVLEKSTLYLNRGMTELLASMGQV